ncbi:unnamed protein product [Amaranthus hypochondriacus]
MNYIEIFILILFPFFFYYFYHNKNGLPTNWPIVGMLPALLKNIHRIHDYIIQEMELVNMTYHFKGPWFTNMDLLVTLDPTNLHHVMTKNFGNYPKGDKFREMLDVLGDSISTTDFNVWQYHRKMAQSFLSHPKFYEFLVQKTWEKVENGLIPILDHALQHGIEIDLQDLFARFTFDTICAIITDHDPKSLSLDMPYIPSSHALDDIEKAIFYRHVVPPFIWKLQRWLDVGTENKCRKAWEILDSFIYKCIALKRESLSNHKEDNKVSSTDLLTLYIKEDDNKKASIGNQGDKFLRDMILSKFIAGKDTISSTLSWFFYLLSKNPHVVSKIKNELKHINIDNQKENTREVNGKLVYLHAALCETLRLYPPIAFELENPNKHDVLPSGHQVNVGTQIIFDVYAMGRMKSVWGDDCNEFKPERWITKFGEFKNEPSHKFFSFNSGPRTCLGKDMAFTQMKIVAATIINKYVIQDVKDNLVVPDISIILHMKYGYKVRILHSK